MQIKTKLYTKVGNRHRWEPAIISLPDNLTPEELFQAGIWVGFDACAPPGAPKMTGWTKDFLDQLHVEWRLDDPSLDALRDPPESGQAAKA